MLANHRINPDARPQDLKNLIACEHCDAVWVRPPLASGEHARCARCNAVLRRYPWIGLSGQLAIVVTAIIVFIIANSFPIVTLDIQGIERGSTLTGALTTLARQGALGVAIVAGATVFLFPMLELLIRALALWLLLGKPPTQSHSTVRWSLRLLSRVQRWSLTEVYVIGILVTLVKLGSMAQVIIGISLVSFSILTVLIGAIRSAGTDSLWDRVSVPGQFDE